MYTVESPAFPKKLTPLEAAQYGPRFTGVGAQILGADDKYICQYSEESQYFWGSKIFTLTLLFNKLEKFYLFIYLFLDKLVNWLIDYVLRISSWKV